MRYDDELSLAQVKMIALIAVKRNLQFLTLDEIARYLGKPDRRFAYSIIESLKKRNIIQESSTKNKRKYKFYTPHRPNKPQIYLKNIRPTEHPNIMEYLGTYIVQIEGDYYGGKVQIFNIPEYYIAEEILVEIREFSLEKLEEGIKINNNK